MTRPNELQQLDEDFAAGRLSADDHRRRRDELVRAAASEFRTASAPQDASPFPPAFRWETSPPEATTQVMQAVGQDSPSYQQSPGQVRGLFQPVDSSAPPWARSDLPPLTEQPIAQQPIAQQPIAQQQSAWMRQGPEVFEAPALPSQSKQVIGIAVLAVIVLGLVGAGVAYFLSAGPQQSQVSSAQSAVPQPARSEPAAPARELPAPPPPRPAPVDTPRALIEPPGAARGGGGRLDLPRLESTDLLPQPILNALRAGAMTDGVLKTTTDDGSTIGMFAFALADEQAATDVVNTITTVQRDGGLKVDQSRAQQGLTVLGTAPGTRSTVYRAVYVLYNRAIFLEVFGPDYDAVLSTFDSIVDQQLTYAPPTVRGR